MASVNRDAKNPAGKFNDLDDDMRSSDAIGVRAARRFPPVKILVVDDHALIRSALRGVLAALGRDVAVFEAADPRGAFDLIEMQPDLDLVLLDLGLPGMHGLTALKELRARHPALPVVVLSSTNDRASVTAALDEGASGYIPKLSSNDVLLSALRLVLSGGIYIPPEILARWRPSARHGEAATPISASVESRPRGPTDLGLSERQAQILKLLLEGKPNKVICRELDLAESTVKNHVTLILKALNVTSRTQAVIAVGRMGIALERVTFPTGAPTGKD
jgi:DNA-binding NarL/FixJ family response regulator